MPHSLVDRSRLVMPELPKGLLMSRRILGLHDKIHAGQAVVICAPAGYGKTTLRASYFGQHPNSRLCWLRLEDEDQNPRVFLAHLAETLFAHTNHEFAAIGPEEIASWAPKSILDRLCKELWSLPEHPLCLVLDDYQSIDPDGETANLIRRFFAKMPPWCRLFVLTRGDDNVLTEKQKLENAVVSLTAADLAFERQEIEAYIQDNVPHATAGLAEEVYQRTEGWAAGVALLCQAAAEGALPRQVEPEGRLFRYISGEIFAAVDQDTQQKLARLAILRDFSRDSARQALGIDDADALISQCSRFGMFIQRLPGPPTMYRFHALFREFLLSVLEKTHTPEEIDHLRMAAANYYVTQEAYGRAADHVARCSNPALAMELVTNVGIRFMMVGEHGQLKVWLDALPPDLVAANPILLIFKALLLPQAQNRQAEALLNQALDLARNQGNLMAQYRAATSLVFIHFCNNNMDGLGQAAASLPLPPEAPPPLANTARLLDMMGSIAASDFTRGIEHAQDIHMGQLQQEDQWLCLAYSCVLYYCLGLLDEAQRAIENALELDCVKNIEPAKGTALYLLLTTLGLKGDFTRVEALAPELYAISEKYQFSFHKAGAAFWQAMGCYRNFDQHKTDGLLLSAQESYRLCGNTALETYTRLCRKLLSHARLTKKELEQLKEQVLSLESANPGLLVYELSLSALAALATTHGDTQLAEQTLLRAIGLAQQQRASQLLCGCLIQLAVLQFRQHQPQAQTTLGHALELGREHNYQWFWPLPLATLLEALIHALNHSINKTYACKFLEHLTSPQAAAYLKRKTATLNATQITAFAEEFVQTYNPQQQDRYYLIQAKLLGNPELTINGTSIPNQLWKTKKNKGILDYLLLNYDSKVSRETLMHIFWPEADSKAAAVSLRTAIYQIRKLLQEHGVTTTGQHALIQDRGDGFIVPAADWLELDLEKFQTIEKQLEKAEDQQPQTIDMLEKMLALYQGDIHETGDYGNNLRILQEKLRHAFERAGLKLSEIYINKKQHQQAERVLQHVLNIEPYSEEVCLELIRLYQEQGLHSKATALYNSFKERVTRDLGVESE